MTYHMPAHYYKFISLQNIRRFLDIIINERLYAARYDELNDPMEGVYLTSSSNNANIIRLLRERKYKTRICSLSKDYHHVLLWSHYADGHKGCCLQVSPRKKETPTEISYTTSLPTIEDYDIEGRALLAHKSPIWKYEDEVRFFSKGHYLNVNIRKIIMGVKVSREDYAFFKRLINCINPGIDVCKMRQDDIIIGFI